MPSRGLLSRWPSSTTATSAWCVSGRRCSTGSGTARPISSTHRHRIPDFVKLAEAYGCVGCVVSDPKTSKRHQPGAGHQRSSGGHRLHRRRGRAGVADGGGGHRQRRDHGRAQHAAAVRRPGRRGAPGDHPLSPPTPSASSSKTSPACWHACVVVLAARLQHQSLAVGDTSRRTCRG